MEPPLECLGVFRQPPPCRVHSVIHTPRHQLDLACGRARLHQRGRPKPLEEPSPGIFRPRFHGAAGADAASRLRQDYMVFLSERLPLNRAVINSAGNTKRRTCISVRKLVLLSAFLAASDAFQSARAQPAIDEYKVKAAFLDRKS